MGLLSRILGTTVDEDEHDITKDVNSFGALESQASVRYICQKCGEEHHEKRYFSETCGEDDPDRHRTTKPFRCFVQKQQSTHIWIQILESDDKGKRISIPLFHEDYTDDMEQQLRSLTTGDILTVTLISEGPEGINWRMKEIVERTGDNLHA